MDMSWNTSVWRQFGAAIDMLDNAIQACPDEHWQARLFNEPSGQPEFSGFSEFWYIAYHTLFWLDIYLADSIEGFAPPDPFSLSELQTGMLPERVYTKTELRTYLAYGRRKCRARLEAQTDLLVPQQIRPDWREMSVAELLFYNMRHVQEHAAQLSLFIGQQVGSAPGWVAKAKSKDRDS